MDDHRNLRRELPYDIRVEPEIRAPYVTAEHVRRPDRTAVVADDVESIVHQGDNGVVPHDQPGHDFRADVPGGPGDEHHTARGHDLSFSVRPRSTRSPTVLTAASAS